jgi:aspartate racemase
VATLGIVGGIAPPSTVAYYRSCLDAYLAATGRSLRILIDSIDSNAFYRLLETDDRDGIIEVLAAELRRLATAGADVAIVASNTGHIGFERLVARSPLPVVGIVDAVASSLVGRRRIGLIATTFTIKADVYGPGLRDRGIDVVVPPDADQELIQAIYFGELVNNVLRDESRGAIVEIALRLRETSGVEAIVLGGTELPLLLPEPEVDGLPLVDSGRLHAEAAVAKVLELERTGS